jgi:sodium/bile acid cotransporter 7
MSRLPVDPYIAAIITMVVLASVMPAHDTGAVIAGHATTAAIALLFFLHGARLAPRAALAGASHWRLHIVVLASTFVVFPVIVLAARAVMPGLLTPPLWTGVILLSVLPSTVQSSIAFTSIGRGNVPAALCAATASNLIGMALTPLLVGLLLSANGGFSLHGAGEIIGQLLLPFGIGQLSRPLTAAWALRNKRLLGLVDRGSILLVVYTAFSEGVTQGIWHQLSLADLGRLLAVEEKPGERAANGRGAAGRSEDRAGGAAVDAVPPDPVDGLRCTGETLRRPRRAVARPWSIGTDRLTSTATA